MSDFQSRSLFKVRFLQIHQFYRFHLKGAFKYIHKHFFQENIYLMVFKKSIN